MFSQPDSAYYFSQLQYELALETGFKEPMAAALSTQGVYYAIKGDYPSALNKTQQSLNVYEEIGDIGGKANALLNMGGLYSFLVDYPKSLEYFQKSLSAFEEIGDKQGMSNSLGNIGTIYSYQHEHAEALEYHRRSLELCEEVGDVQGVSGSLLSMGNSYLELGEYTLALDYFERSLLSFEGIGDVHGMAYSYSATGLAKNKERKFRQALEWCEKGLKLAEEIAAVDVQRIACECLYTAHKELGNSAMALTYHEQLVAHKDSLFNDENAKKITRLEMQYDFDKKEAAAKAEQDQKDAIAGQELRRQKLVRNGFVGGFSAALLFGVVVFNQRNRISKEKRRSEELLLNILPEETAQELKEKGSADARLIEQVTVLFTDFKGFTSMSESLSPKELVEDLHRSFSAFDRIMEKYGIEKIKTIGDAYMAAGGLPSPNSTHPEDVVNAALDMAEVIENGKAVKIAEQKPFFEVRIGIHTGPVVAGIVGIKKFQYDIWGDTVNTASRMESSGDVGRVNISQSTYELLKNNPQFSFEARGKVAAKGKGEIEMYFVKRVELSVNPTVV